MRHLKSSLLVWLFLMAILMPVSCGKDDHRAHGVNAMEEAKLVAIYDRENFDEVFIVSPSGDEVAHYILVERDDTLPAHIPAGADVIRVPLKSVVTDSEVYASALEMMEADSLVKGLFDATYATSEKLKKRIANGEVANVGQSSSPDMERIVAIGPDVLLVSYYDGMQLTDIDRLGIPIVKMYDLQESTPLGRAEWIRFLGRLTGKTSRADSIYHSVKQNYGNSCNSGKADSPLVLTEIIYNGIWSVPGGKSYAAEFIRDAGARYFLEDSESPVTLSLSPEQVVARGADADIWLIKFYGDGETLRTILETEPLYKDIKALQEGKVFFSNTAESGLFREFPFRPDLLLQDYRIIFSGDSLSPLRYFQPLP